MYVLHVVLHGKPRETIGSQQPTGKKVNFTATVVAVVIFLVGISYPRDSALEFILAVGRFFICLPGQLTTRREL